MNNAADEQKISCGSEEADVGRFGYRKTSASAQRLATPVGFGMLGRFTVTELKGYSKTDE